MESEEMLAGGLTEPRPATPEIQEIANKVKPQLEEKTKKTYEKFEAIIYRSQVVAGTNYYIKVSVQHLFGSKRFWISLGVMFSVIPT
uniref:Cystatin domain-containing protein n=1 Tax=Sus scrofa TaxID=9823 RepID=A0A8D0RL41_PIG